MKKFDMTKSVWYERYKPGCVDDLVIPASITSSLKQYIESQNIPNMGLFSSTPGTGKSSTAHAIIKDLGGEAMWINASIDKGIDLLRGKIARFASQTSFDGGVKTVVMDECLEENEKVRIGDLNNWKPVKLNELNKNEIHDCVSFNMKTGEYENDTCEIISEKEDEIYEVMLEDGKIINVTSNHPFIILEDGEFKEKSIREGLNEKDDVVCVKKSLKVKFIKPLGSAKVINLTVHKNHTFITENGIVTHNCDHFSKDGQAAFRGFLDEYSQNCRFIFTGNYKEKIITPLLDRLEVYDFNQFDNDEMIKPIFERLKFILENEKIEFDPKDLVPVIKTFYPSIRSMVGALQKFSNDGVFKVSARELDNVNVFDDIMKLVTVNSYTEMITAINKLSGPDNMYSFLYQNAGKYFKPEHYPNVVLTIAKYQHMTDSVRDKNLNLSACLTELLKLRS